MIKRFGLGGIDKELSFALKLGFDYVRERLALHHLNATHFEEFLKMVKGHNHGNNNQYTVEFERHDDKIIITVSKNSLDINYEGICTETINKTYYMIYSYSYKNDETEYPTIVEEGDFFIFSEKLTEHLMCIDIDEIKIKREEI